MWQSAIFCNLSAVSPSTGRKVTVIPRTRRPFASAELSMIGATSAMSFWCRERAHRSVVV